MPIPSLPLEIIHEIASHFRSRNDSETRKAVRAGQVISLVCSLWSQIGQTLRWKTIVIKIDALPSLAQHLDLHPHLRRCIVVLKQKKVSVEEDEQDIDASFRLLAQLVPTLPELLSLDVRALTFGHLLPVLQAASRRPRLEQLCVTIDRPVVWTNELTEAFADGFASLLSLELRVANISVPQGFNERIIPRQAKFKLEGLRFGWSSERFDTPMLAQSLLSSFDSTTLRKCTLERSSADPALFSWLTTCPNLEIVNLKIVPQETSDSLQGLVSCLPQMNSIRELTIKFIDRDDLALSPVTLEVLLAALPPSLKSFRARQLLFNDYLSVPQHQQCATSPVYRKFEAVFGEDRASGNGVVVDEFAFMLWATKENRNLWYRHVFEYATWDGR